MNTEDVNKEDLEQGVYCQKGVPGCFCKVGRPYEYQCKDCRDTREKSDNKDYCVCPPDNNPVPEAIREMEFCKKYSLSKEVLKNRVY